MDEKTINQDWNETNKVELEREKEMEAIQAEIDALFSDDNPYEYSEAELETMRISCLETYNYAYNKIPDKFKDNWNYIEASAKCNENIFNDLPNAQKNELLSDKRIVAKLVALNGNILDTLTDKYQQNQDMIVASVISKPERIAKYGEELKEEPEQFKALVMKMVSNPKSAYGYCYLKKDTNLRDDRFVIERAIESNGFVYKFLDDEFKKDYNLALKAIKSSSAAFHAAKELFLKPNNFYTGEPNPTYEPTFRYDAMVRNHELAKRADLTKDLTAADMVKVIDAVNREALSKPEGYKDTFKMHNLPDKFTQDREVVLAVLKGNGTQLKFCNTSFKNDKELAFTAIKQNGNAAEYMSTALKEDKHFMLDVIKSKPHLFKHAADELKNDKDFVLNSIEYGTAKCIDVMNKGAAKNYYKKNTFYLDQIQENLPFKMKVDSELKTTLKESFLNIKSVYNKLEETKEQNKTMQR